MDAGHALNKILKDIINRSKLLQGYRIQYAICLLLSFEWLTRSFPTDSYVPGYDTHGLPLELKALSTLKLPASSLTPQLIRKAARAEASKGVAIQEEEFRMFGGLGAFGTGEGYKTMDWCYEKRELGVVREMVRKGLFFRSRIFSHVWTGARLVWNCVWNHVYWVCVSVLSFQ